MSGSDTPRFFLILMAALFLTMCKNQEKAAQSSSKPTQHLTTPCNKLTQNLSDDTLAFAAKANSKTKEIAIQKAENETAIQLVQFFQDEFIEGGQSNLFEGSGPLQNNDDLRKNWAEMSYEIIGEKHNHKTFTHRQKVVEDSSGTFTANDVLVVSDNWIRSHWEKSLAATDSSFYKLATRRDYDEKIMKMDIRQQPPCKNLIRSGYLTQ